MKSIKKYSWLFLFTIMVSLAQAQPYHKTAKVELLGIANDTAFKAISRECIIVYKGYKNLFEITIPMGSFSSNKPAIDSLFKSLDDQNMVITGEVEGSVFDLLQKENSDNDDKLEGDLSINGQKSRINESYHIYTGLSRQQGEKTMFLDLRFYFDPSYFEIDNQGMLSNPVELIIQGGFVNQKN